MISGTFITFNPVGNVGFRKFSSVNTNDDSVSLLKDDGADWGGEENHHWLLVVGFLLCLLIISLHASFDYYLIIIIE